MRTVLLWQRPPVLRPARLWRAFLVLFASLLASSAAAIATGTSVAKASNPESNPQTTWVACSSSFAPLSDAAAAALVTHQPENRPSNVPANNYVPTSGQLSAFQGAKDTYNLTPSQQNPYDAFVDGRDGLSNPSTDDLIQWAAHKWGIPEDWLRAEYALESRWSQQGLGDQVTESASDYLANPGMSKIYGTSDVYRSLGITQEGWFPDGHLGAGTEPLRWESTAFNIDYQTAQVRFYYDNPSNVRNTWGDASYVSCQQWNSIGGWFNPYPWNNSGQQGYVSTVQSYLSQNFWTTANFNNTTPPSQPTGLSASVVNASKVHLSWGTSVGASGYEVFRDGSAQPMFAPISGTSMDDTTVSSGGSYTYQVAAVDSNGNLSGKASVSVSDGASNPPPTTPPPSTQPPSTPPTAAATPTAKPLLVQTSQASSPSAAAQMRPDSSATLQAATHLPSTGSRPPQSPATKANNYVWLGIFGLAVVSGLGFWLVRKPL